MLISESTSGTDTTRSSATGTESSAPTSSTVEAMRRWAPPGASSTSPRWAAKRSGRTRPRAIHRRLPTGGGTTTTPTKGPTDAPSAFPDRDLSRRALDRGVLDGGDRDDAEAAADVSPSHLHCLLRGAADSGARLPAAELPPIDDLRRRRAPLRRGGTQRSAGDRLATHARRRHRGGHV